MKFWMPHILHRSLAILLTVILMDTSKLSAQKSLLETIDIQLNSDLLLTGETLFFKFYCHDELNHPSGLSKVAFVEIFGNDLKPVFQTKIGLEKGEGAGYFFVPSKIPSGNYCMVTYTQWMRNFDLISKKEITLINPLDKGFAQAGRMAIQPTESILQQPSSLSLQMGSRFRTRDSVTLGIQNSSPQKAYRLSVNVMMVSPRPLNTFQKGVMPVENQATRIQYLPDLRAEHIEGRIVRKSDRRPLVNGNVALTSAGTNYLFVVAKTDTLGAFHFNLNDPSCLGTDLLVSILDGPSGDYHIEFKNQFLSHLDAFTPSPCQLDSSLLTQVKKRTVFNQIENIYFKVKKDSLNLAKCSSSFYGDPNKIYDLDLYTRFPTLEDILREFIPEVVVSKIEGRLQMRVRNSENKNALFSGKPLLLLDGIPITDQTQLFDFDVNDLKRIEVVTKTFFYSAFQADGIVSFLTYHGRPEGITHQGSAEYKFIQQQRKKTLFSPDYSNKTKEIFERIPDYRIQLLWNPQVEINKATTLRFFTSDVTGNFIVEVKGYGAEGEFVYLTQKFEVSD